MLDNENTKEHLEKYKPYPFYKEADYDNRCVYGELFVEEINYTAVDEMSAYVSVSLFNESMINHELESFENKSSLYFYEFHGEYTLHKDFERSWIWDSVIANSRLMDGDDIHRFFKFRIVDIQDNEESTILDEINGDYFVGDIIFSASPVLSNRSCIVIDDVADSKTARLLDKIYNNWESGIRTHKNVIRADVEIKRELDKFFNCCTPRWTDIFNVAQANCLYCDLGRKTIFFDMGVTRSGEDINSVPVKNALSKMAGLIPDAVFLSHWDLDHILGVCYNQLCLMNTLWFVPNFEYIYSKPTASILRLCNYLLQVGNSKLFMINTRNKNKDYYSNTSMTIQLFLGTITASHGINRYNNGGLILMLSRQKKLLLPGDCENEIIPSTAKNQEIDYIVVPHHGSVMSDPTFKVTSGNDATVYICRGEHPGHCFLDGNIATKYRKLGFKNISNTENWKKKGTQRVNL